MEALGINLGFLFVYLINFLILFVVLRVWVFKPVVHLLEQRRELIAKSLEDARVAQEARANAEKEAQKVLSEAQAERARIVAEASTQAQEVADGIRKGADEEKAAIVAQAREDAEQEKLRVLGDVRAQVIALAISAANKIVETSMDKERQQALLDDFFAGVRDGKVEVLKDGGDLSGSEAEVISALPLTEQEQTRVKDDVLAKLGSTATISFRVDPAILGGLIVRVGDREIDGSARNKLESLRQSLQ